MTVKPHGFTENELLLYRGLAFDLLNTISLSEDKATINSALQTLISNTPLASSTSASLKEKVENVQYLLNNPEIYVQHEAKYPEFIKIIQDCVQEKINFISKLTNEQKEEALKSQLESQLIEIQRKKELEAYQAQFTPKSGSTEPLYEFICKEVKALKIGREWRMDSLVGHETVILHYLTLNKFLKREDFLNLTVAEFIEFGRPELEEIYKKGRKDPEQYFSISYFQQLIKKVKFLNDLKKFKSPLGSKRLLYEFNALPACFKKDEEVVLELIKINGQILQHLSINFQKNRAMVSAAVTQDGLALRYASAELRNDFQIVSDALNQNIEAYKYASLGIKKILGS